jgi:hypothetical protein
MSTITLKHKPGQTSGQTRIKPNGRKCAFAIVSVRLVPQIFTSFLPETEGGVLPWVAN